MQGKEVCHGWEIGVETLVSSESCLYWVAHLDVTFSASELKEDALLTKEHSEVLDNNGFEFLLQDNYETQGEEALLTFCSFLK